MIKLVPIKPKADALNIRAIEAAVRRVMRESAEGAKEDFERTTATWDHGVDFAIEQTKDGFNVGTGDAIYGYVDEGTRPHEIRPRRKRILVFPGGSRAKTTPGVIGSSGGSKGSGRIIARKVRHPGTKARRFSEIIHRKWQAEIPLRMNEAIGGAVGRD